MTESLSIQNLNVFYGNVQALVDVSLNVKKGETFGLIGLNGAGKTTMIKCVLGLRDQKSGAILIDGQGGGSRAVREKFAYLPERFDPPAFLSGIEFLRFSLKLYRKELPDKTFEDYAQRVALDPAVLSRSVHTYSKGMRQKLGLLGTILTGCELLILDEPMSGLDPRARTYVKTLLGEVKAQGRTVFLSSHILSDMAEICDHVAVLHDRRIVFDGTPKSMMAQGGSNDLEYAFLKIIENKIPEAA